MIQFFIYNKSHITHIIISSFNSHVFHFLQFHICHITVSDFYVNGEYEIRPRLRKQKIFIHECSSGIVSIGISR